MDGSKEFTNTKCPRKKSQNGVYAIILKDSHLFFRPQCRATIGSSRPPSTPVGMEA
jgi:hypothetical protein